MEELPLELAELRRGLEVGATVDIDAGTGWREPHLRTVVTAGAFEVRGVEERPSGRWQVRATAAFGLPDHVGPGMRLLCCGLNPSVHAAEAGVGYVTGSNRFWRAAVAAGLTDRERDPVRLLRRGRVGMTDIVKRPTPRAAELTTAEYREGVERLAELCGWLRPAAVAMVGLAGWRAAVDRRAEVGWQPAGVGGAPVYVLPSTSGLNARVPLAELAAHLRAAASRPAPADDHGEFTQPSV